jgi:hypothetical protein
VTDHLEEQWRASAQALGLTLRKQTWRSHIADNFGAMMRSLGPVVGPTDEVRGSWMVGMRRGAHVVVDISWPAGGLVTKKRSTPTTDVVVAIDPPLLLGLRARSVKFIEMIGGGHGPLDGKFEVSAFMRERAARLLDPHTERLLAIRNHADEVVVTDNLVHVGFRGRFFEAASLGHSVDGVIDTAQLFAEERAKMGEVEDELPYRDWAAFAGARELAFDPARMKIEGEQNGIAVELRFCTANGAAYVAARARIPRSLGLGLRIGAQTADDGAVVFFDDDSIDIEIGDPIFDETFVVEASDENRARALLAAPAIRHTALDIVRAGGDIVITDTSVAISLRDPRRLDWLLEHVTTLAGSLGGGTGPYR